MNSITPIYGKSLKHNPYISCLFASPPLSPPKNRVPFNQQTPMKLPTLQREGFFTPSRGPRRYSPPLPPPLFNRHLCVRSWKNSGRAIASLRTLKTSGTYGGNGLVFRRRLWGLVSLSMLVGFGVLSTRWGGGEGGSCWFGWLENKEMLICSVCIYIVILHVYILVIHLQYIFMLYCFNLTEKKGWKSKKVTISSSQKSNT